MIEIDTLFRNRKIRIGQLLPFGFSESGDAYTYSTSLVDGQFEMTVTVTKKGKVSAEVIDSISNEYYVLHRVPDATGAFVGKVREEYEGVLATVADACFESDVFKSEGARRVIQYVREKYRDELQFLWKRFPNNAIFRRQDNAKWYAALLILQKQKLGLGEEGTVDIIDLRIRPEEIDDLVDGKKYFPGYHMNKKHWFTVCLDGSVPIEEIFRRTDASFALATK
ncbi:MmcQ/YjbR family DNA-binding protein [Azonexus sp.]|jgi:predicted DNA-binding protein (MmcQ/YjbR family)|uniref:MmcQ/YjbR family DNA-binding protein n=1 Tax=Azonexus sp. TaxID=1872668 RepID=UPI0028387437|nr:MmcQ/YjbR family DNA-binding protein [Azonexus sp.]MDR1995686.1 MmcQ/YjbR family DNA-binding protein [Azonexus sp.]